MVGADAFDGHFFEVYPKRKPSRRNDMELTEAVSQLIGEESKFVVHRVRGRWKDTERSDTILKTYYRIRDGKRSHLNPGDRFFR